MAYATRTVDNGSETDIGVAVDVISSADYARVKLALGAEGSATDLAIGQQVAGSSMPVVLPAAQDPTQTQDAAYSAGALRMVGGVRRDAETTPVSADGDVHPLVFNEKGRLKTANAPAQFAPTTGSITASAQTVSADVSEASNVVMYVTGTFAGHNCAFEGTIDAGASWFGIQAARTNANTVEAATGALSAAPAYAWELSVNALTNVRVRATAHTSGTANWRFVLGSYATEPVPAIQSHAVTMTSTTLTAVTPGTAATNLGKARDAAIGATDTGVAFLGVRRDAPTAETPAAGDYVVPQVSQQGAQYVHPTFSGSAAATVAQIISAASTNTTSVKASAGVLTSIAAVNNSASWRHLKLHNTSGAPTAGSGVVATYGIPPGGGIALAFPSGLSFSTGIGASIVAGIAAADATAIGASEVAVTFSYH